MSFVSRKLFLQMLDLFSMFCVLLFSTLMFAVVPWVSGEVVEAADGH